MTFTEIAAGALLTGMLALSVGAVAIIIGRGRLELDEHQGADEDYADELHDHNADTATPIATDGTAVPLAEQAGVRQATDHTDPHRLASSLVETRELAVDELLANFDPDTAPTATAPAGPVDWPAVDRALLIAALRRSGTDPRLGREQLRRAGLLRHGGGVR